MKFYHVLVNSCCGSVNTRGECRGCNDLAPLHSLSQPFQGQKYRLNKTSTHDFVYSNRTYFKRDKISNYIYQLYMFIQYDVISDVPDHSVHKLLPTAAMQNITQ